MTNKDVGRVFSYHLKKKNKKTPKLLSLGGAGVHVQPDCRNRSSDDAPGLRHGRLGGEPGAHHLPGIHEVNMVVGKNTNPSAHKCGQLFFSPPYEFQVRQRVLRSENSTSALSDRFIGVGKRGGIMCSCHSPNSCRVWPYLEERFSTGGSRSGFELGRVFVEVSVFS